MQENSQQLLVLTQLFKVGIDRADMMLETICRSPIKLKLLSIDLFPPQQLTMQLEKRLGTKDLKSVEMVFTGEFQGNTQLMFPKQTATILIDLIESEDRRKLDKGAFEKAIFSEVGNIFYNGIMGVISTLCEYGITYMIPIYKEGDLRNLLFGSLSPKYSIALIGTIEIFKDRNLVFWFQFDTLEKLLEKSSNIEDYFDV
jgi:chemotaxis protein CheY-P-specific phosphatase CheC